ncbi:hypothetical protein [Pseudacidovorax sp. NFM-22]|uniref:hypothetical protein n=1 Tax=Pseudacidovorax sp. NFM-22 TaxID=2744469 RepID=UPI001F316630|nr:hypothetical protein [Pseudacidovorax sp. NFM-22]
MQQALSILAALRLYCDRIGLSMQAMIAALISPGLIPTKSRASRRKNFKLEHRLLRGSVHTNSSALNNP